MKVTPTVKAVKADIAKSMISITFTMEKTPENMEQAEELAQYIEKEVDLVITPKQLPMFKRQP